MKTWKKILKPAMAMILAVVMLCGILPTMVSAAGWDDIPDGGIGFYWGSSGFINVTMPTTEGNYTYGTVGTWSGEELAVDVSSLPASSWDWDWAVQKETDGYRMILDGVSYGIYNRNITGGLMYKCDLTLELRGSNRITSTYLSEGTATIKGTGKLDIVGNGSLNIESNCNGISIDGAFNMLSGTVKVSANEKTIVADSVEFNPNIHALTSVNNGGTNAKTYAYSDLAEAKWFKAAYIAPGDGYTVKFNPEDYDNNSTGTGSMENVENVSGAYTLPDVEFTPELGMRFKAWKTSDGERMPGELILVSANTTISAVWEDDPDTFYVYYQSNGGSGYMQKSAGVVGAHILPDNGLTPPPGMMFKAWRFNDIEYAPGDTVQITKDTYVYAEWKDDPTTIALYFDANGGSGTRASVSNNNTEPFQSTLPKNEWPNELRGPSNTYFAGWLLGDTLMQPGDTITVTEDTTVKACWKTDKYGIRVGDVDVSYQNADNITSNSVTGTVSYDYETKTLTLNNATIYSVYRGGTMTSAIDTDNEITINLIGDNYIYGDLYNGPATSSHRYSVSAGGITFTGNGNLEISASNTDRGSFYYAISTSKDYVVEGDCTITIISERGTVMPSYSGALVADNSTVFVSTSATGAPIKAYGELNANAIKYMKIQPAYTVNVSFDANGGTGNMADITPVCSKEYILPECGFAAPEGQWFKAWSINDKEMLAGDKVYFIEDTSITAIWKTIVLGDVNDDSKTNTTDLAEMKLFLAGDMELDGIKLVASDINKDELVNTTDLAALKLLLAGSK